jgi:hypothetical protein
MVIPSRAYTLDVREFTAATTFARYGISFPSR